MSDASDLLLRAVAASPPIPPPGRGLGPGETVDGRFVIERLAGRGGMGAVYRARDLQAEAPVAIKVVQRPRDAQRFEQEARLLSTLAHPGVVRYIAHGARPDGQLYLAMEWLEGEDLARRLAGGGLGARESLLLARQAASGLAAAHAVGVVHRDVKPSNLFLVGGDPARVKLLDFGVARLQVGAPALTRGGAVLGTYGYMAPEQAAGARDLDARVDVFSLGCVLFECLAGRPAFPAERPVAALAKVVLGDAPRLRAVRPELPAALDDLLKRMLAKDRAGRPADGAAVLEELDRLAPLSPSRPHVSVILARRWAGGDLEPVLRPFGGSATTLVDGSLVVTLRHGSTTQAAALATALRETDPAARVAVADATEIGDAIDRASIQLEDELELPVVDPARFRIDGEIARGGMGRILAAEDLRLRRPVAIKELILDGATLLRRFEREVALTARLQHPGIVGVHEAGRWSNGQPFFVMRRVRGRSLEQALAAARGATERLALLPHAVAAVEALAYAHNQRVIHRDLKPANILVGDYGETVVIDWGLAKDLTETAPDSEPAPSTPADSDGGGPISRFGDVLGTPAYMSPEQAAGGTLDERTDVYAMGAILYHLLSGTPPHSGHDATEVIARVRSTPPVPLVRVAPSTPEDLLALVAKAMHPDPARRYPTAAPLAEDLVRFQTGRLVGAHRYTWRQLARRFVRRHRAALAVAAVLTALLVGLSAYGVRRIVGERDLAREQRETAERLVSFVMTDLSHEVERLGRLDLLGGVAGEVDRYYRGLAGMTPGLDESARGRRASALALLAEISGVQGDRPAALERARASLAIREALLREHPGDPLWSRAVAASHELLGKIERTQGNERDALAAFQLAEAILAPIAGEPETDAQLAGLLVSMAEVMVRRGAIDEALARYRRALALGEAVVAARGTREDRWALTAPMIGIADVLKRKEDLDGALALYRRARDLRLAIVAEEPRDMNHLEELGLVRFRLAQLLIRKGLLDEAQVELEQDATFGRHLVELEPANLQLKEGLAVTLITLGDTRRRRGDLDGALADLRAAVELNTSLSARDPSNARARGMLSGARLNLGRILAARSDLAGALAELRAAAGLLEPLVAADPDETSLGARLAAARADLGDVLSRSGEPAAALAAYRASAAALETVIAREPAVRHRSNLAVVLGKAAALRRRQPGGAGDADQLLRRAIDLLRELQAEGQLDAGGAEALRELAGR